MTVFSATFTAATISVAQDMFEILAPSTSRVIVHEVVLSQHSAGDFVDAQAEILPLTIVRGHSVSGSGGSTAGVANLNPYGRAAVSTVERNNTTGASSGSPEILWADGWHVQAGFIWRLSERLHSLGTEGKIMLKPSQRLVVRIGAPADSLDGVNGTLLFEEIGVVPVAA